MDRARNPGGNAPDVLGAVPRILPRPDGPSGFFWTSGRDGLLRFLQCVDCRYLIHPPAPFCPSCHGRRTCPAVVSGRATVYSFTVNHQPWDGIGDVYVIAVVELAEQPGLRLMSNIIDVDPSDVAVGMSVQVAFEDHDPVYLPMFRPIR
jgi:uncharacterized protein